MQPGSKTQCERGNWIAENGLPVLAGRCGPWFVNSETDFKVQTVKVVKLCPQIVDASRAAWRPGGAAALAAAAACRRAFADHRPGEGEAEAGGEEAAMAAKRIGGSGARGWGGS
jgi:hypothetical protein